MISKTKKSVCVFGPPGCGKSFNAERMRKALELKRVIELDSSVHRIDPKRSARGGGALVLCIDPPPDLGIQTMRYEDAMRLVDKAEGKPVGHWRRSFRYVDAGGGRS